jgi:hypothetical protein
MLRKAIFYAIMFLAIAPTGAFAFSPFSNLQEIISKNNFADYYKIKLGKKVKIALFDVGFTGYKADLGKFLPPADLVHAPLGIPNDIDDPHGKFMAEIIYALMTDEGRKPELAPEFYFYTIGGLADFRKAISDAIDKKVQIISQSGEQQYGSNWDGKGFFNKEVDRATNEKIIFVNAAGNQARQTFNWPIVFDSRAFVNLPDDQNSLTFDCTAPTTGSDTCDLRIFLTWNDFKDDPHLGTAKDLDLLLIDSLFQRQIAIADRVQVSRTVSDTETLPQGQSSLPREFMQVKLPVGTYHLEVKSTNPSAFDSSRDQLRVSIYGEHVTLNHFSIGESLVNPADNPSVVTVGAFDPERPELDATTGVSRSLHKPELLANSYLQIGPNSEYGGNSVSTAIVTAGFALLKYINPNLDRQELLNATSSNPTLMNGVFSLP